MIDIKSFFNVLEKNGINFFTGVPDSLLKEFCSYVSLNHSNKHIIAANEGGAIGIAIGYYLSTGKIPLVYLQNSGLGNCINPLLSLADKEVYGVPMILLIGWRGEPNIKDEPQHIKQGRVQNELLDKMEIPYKIIDDKTEFVDKIIVELKDLSISLNNPVALIVKKDTFTKENLLLNINNSNYLSREQAISCILNYINKDSIFISTTGMTSRELFELREINKEGHDKDFLTVGGMGHCSQIALGISLNSKKNIICLDGDGALLMHLGSMPIIGEYAKNNFLHILLNNASHDSVGGQSTVADKINFKKIASEFGYKQCYITDNKDDLKLILESIDFKNGPYFLEIKIIKGARNNLGRPNKTPKENKEQLMNYILNVK